MTDVHELLTRAGESGDVRDPSLLFTRASDEADGRRARRRRKRVVVAVGLAASLVLFVGAGLTLSSRSHPRVIVNPTTPPPSIPPRYSVIAAPWSVAADGSVTLCGGGMELLPNPPQCAGPIVRVSSPVPLHVEKGTTYRFVGTFAHDVLSITEPAVARPVPKSTPTTPDFPTPCPAPPGGWRIRADHVALDDYLKVTSKAESLPGFAGTWQGAQVLPQLQPLGTVLNFAYTGDIEQRRRDLESIWGGPICVSRRARSWAELERIRDSVRTSFGLEDAWVGLDPAHVRVTASVLFLPPGVQQRVDARFGRGLVVFEPWLQQVR